MAKNRITKRLTSNQVGEARRSFPGLVRCSRLLANCVIYYNAAILSRVLEERRAVGDLAGVEQLIQVAPIAWQHINFYGRYEFTSRVVPIDLKWVVAALLQSMSSGTEHVA